MMGFVIKVGNDWRDRRLKSWQCISRRST